jgi:glucose-1-phosphate cytidylyltransferase
MKIYSAHGINDFVICCGYKGYMIKEYFANYSLHMSDVTFDMQNNSIEVHQKFVEPWKITLVDTGVDTMTGGRLGRVKKFVGNDTFCFTYGDGLGNINIRELIDFHKLQGKKATVTAVKPAGRFGALEIKKNNVLNFKEKPLGDGNWINGGFFILEPKVLELIQNDKTIWEKEPIEKLVEQGELAAYRHTKFWHPLDTLRDKNYLEELWTSGNADWKVW